MNETIVLKLVPKAGFDFDQIVIDYSNGKPVDLSKCEVLLCDSIVDNFKQDFIDYILQHGFSSLITADLLLEQIVSSKTNKSAIAEYLVHFLKAIEVDKDLIIVDPYFFNAADEEYWKFIELIFEPFIEKLKTLRIVTLPGKVNNQTKTQIIDRLKKKNPEVSIEHTTSQSFHDRFWINGINKKGFLTGTSLNGLGKKYALVDYLEPIDVEEIVLALSKESLI